MKNREPIDILSAVSGVRKSYPKLSDGIICKKIDFLWLEIAGKNTNLHTSDLSYTSGVLSVKLDSDVLKNELLMRRSDIISKINAALGSEQIRDILFI